MKLLSCEEKGIFEEQGYLVKKGLMPRDWVAEAAKEFEGIHERAAEEPIPGTGTSWEESVKDGPPRIRQLMHSEVVSEAVNRMVRSEMMLDIVEDLMGPDISLYHSKLLPKAAGDGQAVPWHQDYAYWKRKDNKPVMVNCQLALKPATLESGCIQFVPGSHKWGLKEHERKQQSFGVFLPGHYYEREDAVAIELEPGDGVFFGALIIHGSAPNRSSEDRLMNTIAYNVTGNGRTQCREVLRGKPLPE